MGSKNNKKRNKNLKSDDIQKETSSTVQESLTINSDTEESSRNEDFRSELKRQHSENENSEPEEKPKKVKKKKKQLVPPETSGKKTKSIRQIKREKHAKRQAEAEEAAKDNLKSECLSYLSQWKHNRQNWKFMKIKQLWLFKNKFSTQRIPDETWPILLEYFDSAKGNIRKMLLDDAHKVIKQMDEWTEEQTKEEENNEEESEVQKPDDCVYKRARSLIQCLQE